MTAMEGEPPGEGERPRAVDDEVWTELVASFHASSTAPSARWPDAENLPQEDDGFGPPEPPAPDPDHLGLAGLGDPPGGPAAFEGPAGPGSSRVVRPAFRPEGEAQREAAPPVPPRPAVPPPSGVRPPAAPRESTYWTSPTIGPRDWDTAAEPDEPYVPPAPPPLPEVSTAAKAALLVGLGGPAYLVVAAVLNWQTPSWAALVCVLCGVAGFGYLVSRLKGSRDEDDDDPDDNFGAVV
ncbi:MAG TPA: hypothetical protein VGM10_01540 [Actinocrinis sp.]|jgi:hypothetical protein